MRIPRIILFILLLIMGSAPTTWAHARLLRAEPAKGAEVFPAPGQIDLWFNELLEDGFNTLAVFPATELASTEKHSNLVKDKPLVDPKDRTHLTVKLPLLPPGEYIVEWRVLSRDGHSAQGRSTFRVREK